MMPEEALTSFTASDAYRYSLRVRHSYTVARKSVAHLTPTHNVMSRAQIVTSFFSYCR